MKGQISLIVALLIIFVLGAVCVRGADNGAFRVTMTQSCSEKDLRYYTFKDAVTGDYYFVVTNGDSVPVVIKLGDD